MSEFGTLLKKYRRSARDPERGGLLTQERLAIFLEEETGLHYSPSMISYWENGKSQINKDDRSLLAGLIKVLHNLNGLDTIEEANGLLTAGRYSPLSAEERKSLFVREATIERVVTIKETRSEKTMHRQASEEEAIQTSPSQELTSLRQNLVRYFSKTELKDLCFDLRVDYETFTGDGKLTIARELVLFCERNNLLPKLTQTCRELRPHVQW